MYATDKRLKSNVKYEERGENWGIYSPLVATKQLIKWDQHPSKFVQWSKVRALNLLGFMVV